MSAGLALAALLAAACVIAVAAPFLRDPDGTADTLDTLDARERELLALAEARDRALAALKELEADHRSGRLPDDDYRSAVGPLRAEAARALRAVDAATEGLSGPAANIPG